MMMTTRRIHLSTGTLDQETRVALVTGIGNHAKSGVSELTAIQLASHRFKLHLVGPNESEVKRVAMFCSRLNGQRSSYQTFVFDHRCEQRAISNLVGQVIRNHGRLDLLVVNCSEILEVTDANELASLSSYREIMRANVDIPLELSLRASAHIKISQGAILYIIDIINCPPTNPRSYAIHMAQASMRAFAKSLAVDLSPHVRVNTVSLCDHEFAPSPLRSSSTGPMGADYAPVSPFIYSANTREEIGELMSDLVSDKCSFMNGTELIIEIKAIPSNTNTNS